MVPAEVLTDFKSVVPHGLRWVKCGCVGNSTWLHFFDTTVLSGNMTLQSSVEYKHLHFGQVVYFVKGSFLAPKIFFAMCKVLGKVSAK